MRVLLILVALLSTPAFSQSARTTAVEADDNFSIGIGEDKLLRVSLPFATVSVASKTVLGVSVLSDQMISLTGQSPGKTLLVLQDGTGKTIYSAMVSVNPDAGRAVKIYGLPGSTGGSQRDYTSYYCTDTACGRADKDMPRDLSTTTVRRPIPGGGFIESTTQR